MTLQFCSCDISAILTPVINCTLLIWPPLCTSSCWGHNFYKHHSSYCKCYRKNQTNKAILGEKKCILMLILLEINAFIKIKIQLSYLARLGILFFIKHISKVGCGHRFIFFGMAIFPIFFILEEQISVESLVEKQKSRLIFI